MGGIELRLLVRQRYLAVWSCDQRLQRTMAERDDTAG
jgi:hypothetical protein